MKCVHCGTENKLKDRTANGGACKSCRRPFVFEPTTMGKVKITDPMFAKAIADISVNNTLSFTPQQLLYFLDGRLRQKLAIKTKLGWIASYVAVTGFLSIWFGVILSAAFGPSIFFWVGWFISAVFVFSMYRSSQSEQLNAKQRQNAAVSLSIIGPIILVLGLVLSIGLGSFVQFGAGLALGLGAIYLGLRQTRRLKEVTQKFLIVPEQLQSWLKRWQTIHGSISGLLPAPSTQLAPADINPEVSAYSFDRLVVCQTPTIAQFLIANHFHFEHNCAILSINGYPENIFETTLEMVRRNPDLKVYVLHDCSVEGLRLIHQIKQNPQWFQTMDVAIVDVGLTPRQVMVSKRDFFVRQSQSTADIAQELADLRGNLLATEVDWLAAGNVVELASFSPQKLIQVLHRSISSPSVTDPMSDGGSLFVGDSGFGGVYFGNSGGDLYTSDSFG